MNIKVGDIVSVADERFIVLTSIVDNNINYVFANKLDSENIDTTEDYYVLRYGSENSFIKVTDDNEINRLFPKIQEGLKQSMIENGINLDEFANNEG